MAQGRNKPELHYQSLPVTIKIPQIFKAYHRVEENDANEKHTITRLLHSRNPNLQMTHIVQYNAIFIISLFDRIEMWPLLALLLFVQHGSAVQCDKDSGPSGATGCIQMSRYNNQYQWATCLTNTYIKQKSGHKKECIDNSWIYCWYECMLEVYNQDNGPVTKDCSCNPSLFTASTNRSLPAECYSPAGDSCDWYRNCLEKKYPCEHTSNAYAIRYAEKFCMLYDKRYSSFSLDGKKWVDGVRKCLQVALVPLLRPWKNPSCEQIRKTAFASHTPCYLHPDKDVPSICDLDCSEYFKIFWTIKGSFTELDTAWESVKGIWNIGSKCGVSSQIPKCFKLGIGRSMKITRLKVEKSNQRSRRFNDPLPEDDAHTRFVDGIGSAIARALKWNSNIMDWIAHPDNETHFDDPDGFYIVIVLVDKRAIGIVSTFNQSVNLNHTVQEFASAVTEGKLPLEVHGSSIWVKSLASCSDKFCDQPETLAVRSDKPLRSNNAAGITLGIVSLLGAITVTSMSQTVL